MCDFNANINKEGNQKKAAGKSSIHDISNEKGNPLGQFATGDGLKIRSTTFPHKSIRLGPWKIPGSRKLIK
jgi:hypothetical protein